MARTRHFGSSSGPFRRQSRVGWGPLQARCTDKGVHPRRPDLAPSTDVYIGRGDARRGLPPSKLGNPWKIGVDGDRNEVISRFRKYAEDSADIRLEARGLLGKRLICHCLPGEPCHGDVLIELAIKEHARLSAGRTTPGPTAAPPGPAPEAAEEMLMVGLGDPFTVARKGVRRHIVDGAGVCSPGKWSPDMRKDASKGLALEMRTVLERGTKAWATAAGTADTRRLVMMIAAAHGPTPMPDSALVRDLQAEVTTLLVRRGHSPRIEGTPGRIHFGLLAAMAEAFEDPDAAFPLEVAKGVPVGVATAKGDNPMPRAPAIYEAKTKWALPEPGSDEWLQENARWARNYPSARAVPAILERSSSRRRSPKGAW